MPYRETFRISSFRNFWLGYTFSSVGDAMTSVALLWLVYELTDSPTAIAELLVCYTAPVVVGGFLAGTLLDRFDRRLVMIADSSVRGAAVACIPILNFLGLFALWQAYFVAIVYGFFYMMTLAGTPSIIPDLVPEGQLTTANALESLTFTVSGVVGPPLAGAIIVAFGAKNVMVVDAASYATLVLALASFRLPAVVPKGSVRSHSIGDAFHLLYSNKILLSTTLMFMSFNFGEGILSVWLPILTKTVLAGGPELYGILLGVLAVGQVVGVALADRLAAKVSLGRLIISAQTLSGASLLVLMAGGPAFVAGIALALLGFFSGPLTAWAQTLRMKVIPSELRGRTFALLRTFMQAAAPSGSGVAGLLLPLLGLLPLVGVSAAFVGTPGVLGLQVKELRDAGRD
ncbi:MAG TPA: MFS transporter [Nitrososphaerales archaeon]